MLLKWTERSCLHGRTVYTLKTKGNASCGQAVMLFNSVKIFKVGLIKQVLQNIFFLHLKM